MTLFELALFAIGSKTVACVLFRAPQQDISRAYLLCKIRQAELPTFCLTKLMQRILAVQRRNATSQHLASMSAVVYCKSSTHWQVLHRELSMRLFLQV